MDDLKDVNTWLSATRDYCSWISDLADDINKDCQDGGNETTMNKLLRLISYSVSAMDNYMLAEERKKGE